METADRRDDLVIIAGATATGKTDAALELAENVGGELIGADSIQVYRRLDIGSAKPSRASLRGIAHHLIDVVDLDSPFDAARWAEAANRAIEQIRARGRVPIVVGGTGLYLRALVRGLAPGIPGDPVVRSGLNARAARGDDDLARMHAELAIVDPAYAARVSARDRVRVVRALEVFEVSGEPISAHHARHAAAPPRHRAQFFCLQLDRDSLRGAIESRVRTMLAAGWIAEVRTILEDGFAPSLKPLRSVGYAQVIEHLRKHTDGRALEDEIVRETLAFAKRQRTWFRGERDARWVSRHDIVRLVRTSESGRDAERR